MHSCTIRDTNRVVWALSRYVDDSLILKTLLILSLEGSITEVDPRVEKSYKTSCNLRFYSIPINLGFDTRIRPIRVSVCVQDVREGPIRTYRAAMSRCNCVAAL